jgi:membrane associated rhomboid family serine protease
VHRRQGRVTLGIIGLCLAAFVAQVVVPGFTAHYALFGIAVADGQWWRLVTAGFLHGGLLHLGLNMLALWVVGPPLEIALGRARFAALYLTALVAGSTASYLFNAPLGYSLGASGAVFGLFGATIVVLRRLRRDVGPFVGIIVINLLLPLFFPNIDWRAHVGGLVAGVVVAGAYAYAPRRLWTASAVTAVAAVLAGCALLVGAHTREIRSDPRYAPLLPAVPVLEEQVDGNPLA